MIKILINTNIFKPVLRNVISYNYFIQDLMKFNLNGQQTILYVPASHLYLSKIEKQQFLQKPVMRVLLQFHKIKKSDQQFKRIFKLIQKNLSKINSFKSIVTILHIGFYVNLKDQQLWFNVCKRGFQILQKNDIDDNQKSYSYGITKKLIAINKMIGLRKFQDKDYHLIKIRKIKPLFLMYMLQLFWVNNMQNEYKFAQTLLKQIKQNQNLIPFSDVHHMMMARKKIKDPVFYQISEQLNKKLKQKVSINDENNQRTQSKQQTRIDPQVVSIMYKEYMNDLKAKYL